MKKKKTKTKGWYIQKLDIAFSRYIRNKYADWRGYVQCYTCGKEAPVQNMQNGHYIPRSFMATRFLEANCRPQCVQCNVFKKGNYTMYALRLVQEKGKKELERLEKLKQTTKQYTIDELKKEIEKYT